MSPTKKEILDKSYFCEHWGKYHVKNTAFSLESAHHLLKSLQSKKDDYSVKAKLNAYHSMFKLIKKSGFGSRSQKIPFLSIQRFFVFKDEPHLIFLGVEKKKRLSYIVILFRDINDVNDVCDLIEKKKRGFTKETDIRTETEVTICCPEAEESEPTVVVCYEREINEKPPITLVSHQTQSEPMEEKVVYIQSEEVYTVPVIRPNIEYHYDERHTDDMGATSIDAILVRTNRSNVNSSQWAEDMKYLEYNPVKGTATETEFGPIYMYTAHFTPADNNTFGSCESDDSWSGKSIDSVSSSDHQGVITKKHDGRTVITAHRGSDARLYL